METHEKKRQLTEVNTPRVVNIVLLIKMVLCCCNAMISLAVDCCCLLMSAKTPVKPRKSLMANQEKNKKSSIPGNNVVIHFSHP